MAQGLSWITVIGTGAMILSGVLLFVYLFLLRTYEDERKLQKARKQLLNLPEDSEPPEASAGPKGNRGGGGTGDKSGKDGLSASRMEAIQQRKKELGLIGSAGTGTLRNRKNNKQINGGANDATACLELDFQGEDQPGEEDGPGEIGEANLGDKLQGLIENLNLENAKDCMDEIDKAV